MRSFESRLGQALLLLTALGGYGCTEALIAELGTCEFGGQELKAGEAVKNADGCNSCECQFDGTMACAALDCETDAQAAGGTGTLPTSRTTTESRTNGVITSKTVVDSSPGAACEFEGKPHRVGEKFSSKDGCTTCLCEDGGVLDCGEVCVDGPGCDYKGKHYAPREQFPADDGCDTVLVCLGNESMQWVVPPNCPPAPGTCVHEGRRYYPGGSYTTADNCNVCTCGADGAFACTDRECGAPISCNYNGKEYVAGQTFPDANGCGMCTCSEGGVQCDNQCEWSACKMGDDTFRQGSHVVCDDGCNSCTCVNGGWMKSGAACGVLPSIVPCDDEGLVNPPQVKVVYRSNDALAVEIEHYGCSEGDAPTLCYDKQGFVDYQPGLRGIELRAHPPKTAYSCPQSGEHKVVFDISPLRALYRKQFNASTGKVALMTYGERVSYSF